MGLGKEGRWHESVIRLDESQEGHLARERIGPPRVGRLERNLGTRNGGEGRESLLIEDPL